MPIKNSTTGQIPYLEQYTPYKLSTTNQVEVVNIADMITYDLTPSFSPTQIQYKLGSTDLYIKTLNIKNITSNADIELKLTYSHLVFYLNFGVDVPTRDTGIDSREVTKILKPMENVKIDILLNNSLMDLGFSREVFTDISITARNLVNGKLVTKNPITQKYQPLYFPRSVRIE
jgi:hypothetical protein